MKIANKIFLVSMVFSCMALTLGIFLSRPLQANAGRQRADDRFPWKPCHLPGIDGEAHCGTYEVYENRATRSGRQIRLNVIVLPALGPNPAPDPVFWLNGGPGVAATPTVVAAQRGFLQVFRQDHDLVFVDQRGTGKSNPLECNIGDDPSDLQSFFGKLFPPDAIRSCREKLEKIADLRLYTTSVAMDDLDDLRKALGYAKINIVAVSYGTIAAQVYMRRHPGSARAAFLVGVATPGIRQPLPFAPAAQHALDLLFIDCASDPACSAAFPKLRTEFYSVLARFDHGPVAVNMLNPVTGKREPVKLERENYVERIRFLLYSTASARFLPLVIHKAYEGDFLPFEGIAIRRNPGSQVARGMYMTVTCSEGIPFITEKEIVDEAKGTFVGETRVRSHQQACRQWPRSNVPNSFIEPVQTNVPVLMISGELDGAASPSFGKTAMKFMPNGEQVKIRYYGHQLDSPCIFEIEHKFIQRGSVRGLDTSCVTKIRRPSFIEEMPVEFSIQVQR